MYIYIYIYIHTYIHTYIHIYGFTVYGLGLIYVYIYKPKKNPFKREAQKHRYVQKTPEKTEGSVRVLRTRYPRDHKTYEAVEPSFQGNR